MTLEDSRNLPNPRDGENGKPSAPARSRGAEGRNEASGRRRGARSVGEALRAFMREAPVSGGGLSSVELERLERYNPTLAAQVRTWGERDLPPLIAGIINEWRAAGCPVAREAAAGGFPAGPAAGRFPKEAFSEGAGPEETGPARADSEETGPEDGGVNHAGSGGARGAGARGSGDDGSGNGGSGNDGFGPAASPETGSGARPFPFAVPFPVPLEVPGPAAESVAAEQAAETRRQVADGALRQQAEQGSLLVWCGYPTPIARVSPFFPMNNMEKGRRDAIVKNLRSSRSDKSAYYLINELVSSGPWGEIVYTGPKLSVEEEDTLMALLAILEAEQPRRRRETSEEGMVPVLPDAPQTAEVVPEEAMRLLAPERTQRRTFTYRGPMLPILRLMGHRRPGANHYGKVITSLKCLALGSMELCVREKGEDVQHDLSHILSNLRWKPREHEISVTVNEFFYEMYLANSLTWIDVATRFRIRGSLAKAMYRFCQSHRENPVYRGGIAKLALALNMPSGMPMKEMRRQIREAIAELVEKKVLEKTSLLTRTNIVILNRTAEALPPRRRSRTNG